MQMTTPLEQQLELMDVDESLQEFHKGDGGDDDNNFHDDDGYEKILNSTDSLVQQQQQPLASSTPSKLAITSSSSTAAATATATATAKTAKTTTTTKTTIPEAGNILKKRKKKKKRQPHKSKMITGYIIYASEIRKDVIKKYPDRDFGDISKLVGIEWKNLSQETKVAYEKRAQEQNAKSKAIAAEALELKKLADEAEERAKEHKTSMMMIANNSQQQAVSQILPNYSNNNNLINNNNFSYNNECNGFVANGHSQPISNHQQSSLAEDNNSTPQSPHMSVAQSPVQNKMQLQQHQYQTTPMMKTTTQQQQPLQIIQHQQQPMSTTVHYCNNNNCNDNSSRTNSVSQIQQQPSNNPSISAQPPANLQTYQRNNIVYRKPATVRLRPKDTASQTEPIIWIKQAPKKPLRFSQKFIDYLSSNNNNNNKCLNGN